MWKERGKDNPIKSSTEKKKKKTSHASKYTKGNICLKKYLFKPSIPLFQQIQNRYHILTSARVSAYQSLKIRKNPHILAIN